MENSSTSPNPITELPFEDLSQTQKNFLLNKWECLSALRIHSTKNCELSPLRIAELQGKPPESSKRITDEHITPISLASRFHSTRVEAVTTFSEQSASFVRRGWFPESFPDPTTWVPTVDHEQPLSWPRLACITARALYTRTKIKLDQRELKPVEDFKEAIKAALTQSDAKARTQKVMAELDKWGHVLPVQFELGGVAYTTKRVWASSMDDIVKAEEELKIQLMNELTKSHTEISAPFAVPISLIGGDTLSLSYRHQWFDSLRISSNWEIVQINTSIPSVQLLEESILEELRNLTQMPLFHFPFQLGARPKESTAGGWIQSSSLGSNFDVANNFTLMASFIFRGTRTHWQCILSTEGPTDHVSIIWIGIPPEKNFLVAVFINEGKQPRRVQVDWVSTVATGTWNHLALKQETQKDQRMILLYLNGQKEKSFPLPWKLESHREKKLVVGIGMWKKERYNAWDGDIKNVSVFGEALSESQILEDAGLITL